MSTPTIDFAAVCTALGTRFTAANMGTPTGAPAVRAVYPQSAKAVAALPAVILEVQDGEVVANPGQWKHEMNVDVLLLLAKRPADPDRVEMYRQLYLPYLLHATVDQVKIGKGGESGYSVDKALPTTWEWDLYSVADIQYEAIRVAYKVWITETVSLLP